MYPQHLVLEYRSQANIQSQKEFSLPLRVGSSANALVSSSSRQPSHHSWTWRLQFISCGKESASAASPTPSPPGV